MNHLYQKDKDLIFVRRASDNKEFWEYPLIVQPQSFLALSPQNNLYCMPISSIPMSNASSSISSSYALTASDAFTGGSGECSQTTVPSASWVSSSVYIINSDTASYVS